MSLRSRVVAVLARMLPLDVRGWFRDMRAVEAEAHASREERQRRQNFLERELTRKRANDA